MQMTTDDPKMTAYPLTFEAIRLMDDIRRENHCDPAICAYPEGCVCWDELLVALKELT